MNCIEIFGVHVTMKRVIRQSEACGSPKLVDHYLDRRLKAESDYFDFNIE